MTYEHINPDRYHDSAGVPWEGRHFEPNPNANDDGSADPKLIQAIANFHDEIGSIEQVFEALSEARVLIPLVANLGESGEGSHGQKVDKSAELSIVSVSTPDGQVGIPVFSSVSAMSTWRNEARPVPSDMPRVALAAASENATRVILDPGSPTEFVLRRPAIAAMAQQFAWMPPHTNPSVKAAIAQVLETEPSVTNWAIYTEDKFSRLQAPEVTLLFKLAEGLQQSQIDELVVRVTKQWAEIKAIADNVDSLELKLTK